MGHVKMKAVIPAAGFGTRMLPASKAIPKELIPVAGKPVIQYTVEGLAQAGIDAMVMITSHGKGAVADHFDSHFELEYMLQQKNKHDLLHKAQEPTYLAQICYVRQAQQLGFAHAVLHAEPWIDSEYFFLAAPDMIFDPQSYAGMVAQHRATGKAVIGVSQVPLEETYKYGVVDIDEKGDVVSMIEKPPRGTSTADHIQVGLYILPRRIFGIIKQLADAHDGSFHEIAPPDAMQILMQDESISTYHLEHAYRDCGNYAGWLQACSDLA